MDAIYFSPSIAPLPGDGFNAGGTSVLSGFFFVKPILTRELSRVIVYKG